SPAVPVRSANTWPRSPASEYSRSTVLPSGRSPRPSSRARSGDSPLWTPRQQLHRGPGPPHRKEPAPAPAGQERRLPPLDPQLGVRGVLTRPPVLEGEPPRRARLLERSPSGGVRRPPQ